MTHALTIRIEDRPGTLGRLARTLGNAGVNIDAFQADGGTARLIVQDGNRAAQALRTAGFTPAVNEAFEVRLQNRPGELANLGEALGKAGVNVQASFGTAADGRIYLQVDNATAARPILERFGPTTVRTSGSATR